MAHVVVKDLVKKYGELQVVHGIDFEINRGEFVVLVGPSGCGKSTILRMIAGLETVTGGDIVIDSTVVNDIPPRHRNIAMVFQDYALYPHMSVRQNMGFGLKMRGASRSDVATAVKRTAEILQIESLLDRKPKELSGGSASASRSAVPSPASPTSSSSTSRFPTSTPSCASTCAPRSSGCTWPSRPPASTSRTIRSRR